MKISMKGDYGVRAMIDLAQHYGEGPIQSGEIAARQEIPEPYLDQLLALLRRAGLLRSVRGPKGGHALSRPPDDVTLAEVVAVLEGSLAPVPCLDDDDCSLLAVCAQREVWREIEQATQRILNQTTIAELARRQSRREARAMYNI